MIFQPVIVADPLNPVVVDVQPFKALWDGGKVEPLKVVRRDVEPSEVVQRGDKIVQVDQHVVVQPQSSQIV